MSDKRRTNVGHLSDRLEARLTKADGDIQKWWSDLEGDRSQALRDAVRFCLQYQDYAEVLQAMRLLGIAPSDALSRLQMGASGQVYPSIPRVMPVSETRLEPPEKPCIKEGFGSGAGTGAGQKLRKLLDD